MDTFINRNLKKRKIQVLPLAVLLVLPVQKCNPCAACSLLVAPAAAQCDGDNKSPPRLVQMQIYKTTFLDALYYRALGYHHCSTRFPVHFLYMYSYHLFVCALCISTFHINWFIHEENIDVRAVKMTNLTIQQKGFQHDEMQFRECLFLFIRLCLVG